MVISRFPWEIVMLDHYYFRPETIDRIRASWRAPAIEQYVTWLAEAHCTDRSVLHRVPVLMSFGEYAKAHGVRDVAQLHCRRQARHDEGYFRSDTMQRPVERRRVAPPFC